MALTPDDPPSQFRWRGQTHRVRRAEGPERIGEEWYLTGFVQGDTPLYVSVWYFGTSRKPVDANRVSRNHIGWLYTNGTLTGYFTETETDVVAKDGNSYHGTNDQKVYDLEGNLIVEVPGTSMATRIAP